MEIVWKSKSGTVSLYFLAIHSGLDISKEILSPHGTVEGTVGDRGPVRGPLRGSLRDIKCGLLKDFERHTTVVKKMDPLFNISGKFANLWGQDEFREAPVSTTKNIVKADWTVSCHFCTCLSVFKISLFIYFTF